MRIEVDSLRPVNECSKFQRNENAEALTRIIFSLSEDQGDSLSSGLPCKTRLCRSVKVDVGKRREGGVSVLDRKSSEAAGEDFLMWSLH